MLKKYIKSVLYLFIATCFSVAIAGAFEDFFKAVESDQAGTVGQLLARGFDPNTPDERGQLPLYLALRAEAYQVAAALAAHPDTRIDKANPAGETPLMMAAMRGSLEWTQRLVERGAQVDRRGWTPLHYAATGPEPAVLTYLLDRGAAIDARAPNGSTALMMAASYGSERAVQVLLERGADARLRSSADQSAADFARMAGREALAVRLERAAGR